MAKTYLTRHKTKALVAHCVIVPLVTKSGAGVHTSF